MHLPCGSLAPKRLGQTQGVLRKHCFGAKGIDNDAVHSTLATGRILSLAAPIPAMQENDQRTHQS